MFYSIMHTWYYRVLVCVCSVAYYWGFGYSLTVVDVMPCHSSGFGGISGCHGNPVWGVMYNQWLYYISYYRMTGIRYIMCPNVQLLYNWLLKRKQWLIYIFWALLVNWYQPNLIWQLSKPKCNVVVIFLLMSDHFSQPDIFVRILLGLVSHSVRTVLTLWSNNITWMYILCSYVR